MFYPIRLFSVLLIVSVVSLFHNCQGQAIKDQGPAFYYWKTNLSFDTLEAKLAEQLGNQHIYLRYFDVDWSAGYGSAVPKGVLDVEYDVQGWENKSITPTIYITNRTFEHLKADAIKELAQKLSRKIIQINQELATAIYGYSYYRRFPESLTWEEQNDIIDSLKQAWNKNMVQIQIDCDWTQGTRDKYFAFLKTLKEIDPKLQLSSTLRLHQYRDRKNMGIPPVDKVMLMCYNTGDPKKIGETNAILDAQVVKQYLKGKKYPLPIDVALPQFNWGAWYRAGVFQGLLRNLHSNIPGKESYLQQEQDNRYRVTRDTVINQDYLREGDLIRMDGTTPEQMQATLKLLKEQLRGRIGRVAFFDWDYAKIKENQAVLLEYFADLK